MENVSENVLFKFDSDNEGNITVTKNYVLHSPFCENSAKDITLMRMKLAEDPECLHRDNHAATDGNYICALLDAVQQDHNKCVEFLVSEGVDVTRKYGNILQDDIVEHSIKCGAIKCLAYFTQSGMYRRVARYRFSHNHLLLAVRYFHDVEVLDLFLKNGTPVDDFQDYDLTLSDDSECIPTIDAVFRCHSKALKYLLLHGGIVDHRQTGKTDLTAQTKDTLSLIHHFAVFAFFGIEDLLEILNILYQFGSNLWEKNRRGFTPLEIMQSEQLIEDELEARDNTFNANYWDRNDDDMKQIQEKMKELMGTPLPLKSMCRICIIRSMGTKYYDNIDKLQCVPKPILSFLRGEDIP